MTDTVEIETTIDLDALWAAMIPKLSRRGVDAVGLVAAEGLFWNELETTDDWLAVSLDLGGGAIDLAPALAPSFERRFIAKALRTLGMKTVRAAYA